MKIRHFLNNVDGVKECVIDEFLIDKHKMNISEKYLMEIELNDEAEKLSEEERNKIYKNQLEKLNNKEINEFNEVTEDKKYSNSKIAKKEEKLKIPEIIQYVENYLKDEQIVIALLGKSISFRFIETDLSDKDLENFNCFGENDLYKVNKKTFKTRELMKRIKEHDINYDEIFGSSAELDSIYLLKESGYRIKEVVLFVFPDNESSFSVYDKYPKLYEYQKFFIENIFGYKVNYKPLRFNATEYKPTVDNLKNIWTIIDEIRNSGKNKEQEVLVDVVGGYKYPGIMASFYCIFNDIPFFYKYERAANIIKFPKIPVDWDFQDFDEVLTGFSSIDFEKEKDIPYEEYYSLPQVLKNIYSSSDSESTLDSVLPMKRIQKSYEKARKMPFGFGKQFLNLIDNHELREYIKNKISDKWSLQWLGDQIPETVEHSQRHSKRLMEFTVNLINCIGEDNFLEGVPFELKDDFYFVLAVAMNVHDLGHTMLEYKLEDGRILNLKGLPSLVRDLHNELSVQMLNEENRFELLGDKNNDLSSDYKKYKWENAKEAIKLVSKYHRGYMPVDEEKYVDKNFVEIFGLETTSLKDVVKKEFKDDEKWQKLTIMAARWLKFIDGTDVQADRVVDENYHNERLNRTIYEIECLINEFDKNKCEPKIAKNLARIERMLEFLKRNKNNSDVKKKIEEIAIKLEEKVYNIIEYQKNKEDKFIKIDNQIRILDEIAFKARQFPHFKKHRSVKYIYPQFYKENDYSENGNNKIQNNPEYLNIKIELKKEDKELYNKEELYNKIVKEISEEFYKAGLNKNSKIKELFPRYDSNLEKVINTEKDLKSEHKEVK